MEQPGPEAGRAFSSSDTAPVVTTAAAPGQTELVAPAPAQTQGCVLRDIWGLQQPWAVPGQGGWGWVWVLLTAQQDPTLG